MIVSIKSFKQKSPHVQYLAGLPMCGSQGDHMAEAVFVARQKLTCRLSPLRVLEEVRLTYHDSSSKLTSDDMQVIRSFGQSPRPKFPSFKSSRAIGEQSAKVGRCFLHHVWSGRAVKSYLRAGWGLLTLAKGMSGFQRPRSMPRGFALDTLR